MTRRSGPDLPPAEPEVRPPGEHGPNHTLSLEDVHQSVAVPTDAGFWRSLWVFIGPAILVSVGYMDPGNWATDLQSGAEHKYALLWVVALSSLMAMVLQVCSARLGIATGKDLAQGCRDWLPAWTRWPNYLAAEVAIAACDLAEVLGSAVAIHLLFPVIPLFWAVIITTFDVLALLGLQRLGVRKIEAVIALLVATIAVCYFLELFVLPQTRPSFTEMGAALISPRLGNAELVALAIGIIGATVMPHNLYLHSALVQTRRVLRDDKSIRRALRFNTIDSLASLSMAFLVNAAIMVMAAITFYGHSMLTGPHGPVPLNDQTDWIQVAYYTLQPLLGTAAGAILFGIALLASGQSSTITGTIAGQVVMEGFMHWKIQPWVRRLITRLVAVVPAALVIAIEGENSVNSLLVLSQIILGVQLPLAMVPLMLFTCSRKRMGKYANGWILLTLGWGSTILITGLDLYGLWTTIAS